MNFKLGNGSDALLEKLIYNIHGIVVIDRKMCLKNDLEFSKCRFLHATL